MLLIRPLQPLQQLHGELPRLVDLTFLSEVLSVALSILTATLSAGSHRQPHHVCKIDSSVLFDHLQSPALFV
jgi:hypothetical protein